MGRIAYQVLQQPGSQSARESQDNRFSELHELRARLDGIADGVVSTSTYRPLGVDVQVSRTAGVAYQNLLHQPSDSTCKSQDDRCSQELQLLQAQLDGIADGVVLARRPLAVEAQVRAQYKPKPVTPPLQAPFGCQLSNHALPLPRRADLQER